jgi:hypothetical protein
VNLFLAAGIPCDRGELAVQREILHNPEVFGLRATAGMPVDLYAIAGLGLMLHSRVALLPVPIDDGLRRVDGRLRAEACR